MRCLHSLEIEEMNVAIDATGFTSSYSSEYYVTRVNKETSYINFMKMSESIDPYRQLMISVKIRKAPSHDNKDFIPLLKKLPPVEIDYVLADKGYDCEANHRFIRNKLNAEPVIPVKKNISGCHNNKLRKKMRRLFLQNSSYENIYHQRSKVETIFSVIKRKFGENLNSRKTNLKKKEMKLVALTYNIYRINKINNILFNVFVKMHAFCSMYLTKCKELRNSGIQDYQKEKNTQKEAL